MKERSCARCYHLGNDRGVTRSRAGARTIVGTGAVTEVGEIVGTEDEAGAVQR